MQKPTSRVASNPAASTPITAATSAMRKVTEKAGSRSTAAKRERERRKQEAGDNDFLFGAEDPEALRCPFGAHIRRANPRESLDAGSAEQIAISNRHRILRVGRSYGLDHGETDKRRGLMFMCLNGDIERQFEFIQQTWMRSETFHGLTNERDPLSLNDKDPPSGFTIPSRDGPVILSPMQRFVTARGGGYFFLPGRRLLRFLCK